MTTTDREKAFEQWWSFPVSRPDVRKSLAREAYYAAWDEAADEIERLRVMYNDCIKDLREASE
jgi:hypothetical protein